MVVGVAVVVVVVVMVMVVSLPECLILLCALKTPGPAVVCEQKRNPKKYFSFSDPLI